MVRTFGLRQNNRYYAQCLSEKLERNAALYHFRYDPKQMKKGPIKRRPGLSCQHKQRRRSDSRIKKMTQLSRGSGLREARLAYMAFAQLEMVLRGEPNLRIKFHTMASPKKKQKSMLRETFTHDDRWKANWWTTSWWEKSKWTWNDEVLGFFLI